MAHDRPIAESPTRQPRWRANQAPTTLVAGTTTFVIIAVAAVVGNALAGDAPFATLESYREPWFALPAWGWVAIGIIYYIAMAIVVYRILRRLPESRTAVALVIAVIGANEGWNILVFGLGALWAASMGLVAFAFLVALAVRPVRQCDAPSGRILLAYLSWLVVYDLPWIVALTLLNRW